MTDKLKDIEEALEDIKKYDDTYWLRYLSENTVFDTDNIANQKEFLIDSTSRLLNANKEKDAEIKRLEADKSSFMSNCLAAVAEVKQQAEEIRKLKEEE